MTRSGPHKPILTARNLKMLCAIYGKRVEEKHHSFRQTSKLAWLPLQRELGQISSPLSHSWESHGRPIPMDKLDNWWAIFSKAQKIWLQLPGV